MAVDVKVLAEGSLLRPLSKEALARLAERARRLTVEAGEPVFREGEEATDIYVLERGHVAIEIDVGPNLGRTVVNTVGAGECFGWSALVPPCRMTASARAVETSTVIAVPGAALEEAFARDPSAGLAVMRELVRMVSLRLKDTRFQLVNLLHWPSPRERGGG